MSFILIIVLAISVSIDALGIGISYGLRQIKITNSARLIIFSIAFLSTFIAVKLGNVVSLYLPNNLTNILSTIMLIGLGIFIIIQACKGKSQERDEHRKHKNKFKEFVFNIFGLTIKIIRNPEAGDIDKSNTIDAFEAVFLALAVSIDAFGAGVICGVANMSAILVPLFIASFHVLFLSCGNLLSAKLLSLKKVNSKLFEVMSGVLLIVMSVVRCFC